MQLQAGHVAGWIKKGLPMSHAALLDEFYQFTQCSAKNREVLSSFPEDITRLLIAWHFYKGTLLFHRDHLGKVNGLLMWYRCTEEWTWADVKAWTQDATDGNAFFLAFCWAGPRALRDLCLSLIERQPEVITGKLFSLRERKDGPALVKWDQRILVKILRQ